jgi:hypothetical protein
MSSFVSALMKSNDSNTVLFVHSVLMVQIRLGCFGMFIVYMSTLSNVKVTSGCVSLSAVKAAFTLVSIFMPGLGI